MHFSAIHFLLSVLEVYWILNQISTKTFKKCGTMSPALSYLSEFSKDWTLFNVTFLRDTLRKYIGNCSTANVLCKQFRIDSAWERENYGTIQWTAGETAWTNPREDPRLMDKPAEKLRWFFQKDIDMITGLSFVSSVLLISATVNGILGFIISG